MARKRKESKNQQETPKREAWLDEGDRILQDIRAEYTKEQLRNPKRDPVVKSAAGKRRDTQDNLNKVIKLLENKANTLKPEDMAAYIAKKDSMLKDFRHKCRSNHVNPRLLEQFDNIVKEFNKPPKQIHQERLQETLNKTISYLENKASTLSPQAKEAYLEKHRDKLIKLQENCAWHDVNETKLRTVIEEKFENPVTQWKQEAKEQKKAGIREDKWKKFNKSDATPVSKTATTKKLQEVREKIKANNQNKKEVKERETPTMKPGGFSAGG